MCAGSMPKARTASTLVDTAAKWLASWSWATPLSRNHWRALQALAMVSSVVKVLEQTITRVCSGSSRSRHSASSVPSTLETKCMRGPLPARCESARHTMRGPRSEPPMPMLMTSVMRLPVAPVQSPLRTCSENTRMRSSTAWMAGMTGLPSTLNVAPAPARSAMCRTARSSVALMWSPANMASRRFGTPASSASCISNAMVCGVMRFLE